MHTGKKTNHAVLTVGYDLGAATPYWLIKNSWGQLWGQNGYIKVALKHDICGLTNGPLLAVKKGKKEPEFPFEHLRRIHWQDFENDHLKSIPF